jgi:hypothetical protein
VIKELLSRLAVVAAGLSALLAVAGSAHATFLSCREWDARDQNERETYIAGVFKSVSDTPTGMHYYRCVRDKKMMDGELADGVRATMLDHPELQTQQVQVALLYYLNQLCGKRPAENGSSH